MYPCQECEDGRCPCGTGCPTCEHTGTCEHCHGLAVQFEPVSRTALPVVGSTRSPHGARWCPTCRRRVTPLKRPPKLDEMTHLSERQQLRLANDRRCTGCHRAFPDNAERPNSYRLREAS